MPKLHETFVYGDWDIENIYPAVAYEDHGWNGWAIPFFTKETAVKIVRRQQEMLAEIIATQDIWWDAMEPLYWDGDDIISLYLVDLPNIEFEVISPNSDGLYAIGSWGWCWQDVKIHGYPSKRELEELPEKIRLANEENRKRLAGELTSAP